MKKHPLKSITIWSQLVIGFCVIALVNGPKPLEPDFTTEQLCDWALAMGSGQKAQYIMLIVISACLIGIYGRMRVKEHDNDKH